MKRVLFFLISMFFNISFTADQPPLLVDYANCVDVLRQQEQWTKLKTFLPGQQLMVLKKFVSKDDHGKKPADDQETIPYELGGYEEVSADTPRSRSFIAHCTLQKKVSNVDGAETLDVLDVQAHVCPSRSITAVNPFQRRLPLLHNLGKAHEALAFFDAFSKAQKLTEKEPATQSPTKQLQLNTLFPRVPTIERIENIGCNFACESCEDVQDEAGNYAKRKSCYKGGVSKFIDEQPGYLWKQRRIASYRPIAFVEQQKVDEYTQYHRVTIKKTEEEKVSSSSKYSYRPTLLSCLAVGTCLVGSGCAVYSWLHSTK